MATVVQAPGPEPPPQPPALRPADVAVDADFRKAAVDGQIATGSANLQIQVQPGARLDLHGASARAVPQLRPQVRALPRDLDTLVGRSDDIAQLRRALNESLVQLFGSDGVGKTAVLRHLTHRLDEEQHARVVYQSALDRHPVDVLRAVFTLLFECGGPYVAGEGELDQYLRGVDALVVLDEVTWSREQLRLVLDTAAKCKFIVAGQQRLVFGEGRSQELSGLDAGAARALIVRELGRELDDDEMRTVERANALLQGNALRLLRLGAVARVTEQRLSALVETLSPGTGPGSDPTPVLDEDAIRVIVLLAAVFGRPLEAEHVALIAGVPTVSATLERLEAAGLVEAHSPRYSLRVPVPPSVGLGRSPDEMTSRALAFLAAWTRVADPVEVVASANTCLRLAEWGAMERRYDDVLGIVRGLDVPLCASGRWEAWASALRLGLVAAEALEDGDARSWAHHQLGTRASALGQTAQGQAHLQAALALREASGDRAAREVTQHNLSVSGGPVAATVTATAPALPSSPMVTAY